MDAQDEGSSLIFIVLGVLLAFYLLLSSERVEPNLKHIRPIGHSSYLLSYIDALKFLYTGPALLRGGYEKFQPRIFKISTLNRWLVVITSTQHIEELRKAPEEEVACIVPDDDADALLLSLVGHYDTPLSEDTQTLVRLMTQSLTFMIQDLREEIVASLSGAIPTPDISTGWSEIDALDFVLHAEVHAVLARWSYLPSPLGRATDYKHLCVEVTRLAFERRSHVLPLLVPGFFKRVIRFFSKSYRNKKRLRRIFMTMLKERKALTVGIEPPSPRKVKVQNDILSSILQDSPLDSSIFNSLFELSLNANESLSLTFLHVLYHLAANPKYASPMRKEIESIASREGWTKASLEKMRKVDGFVKESMRVSGVSCVTMIRKTLQPFMFSDGTTLPTGTVLCVASDARHLDPHLSSSSSSSSSPEVFDGFRHSRLYEHHYGDSSPSFTTPTSGASWGTGGTGGSTRFQLTTATPDYLAWGYGRHACPGRFFAAVVLKMLLAHVVLGYDVRFEDGMRPEDVVDGARRVPNPRARVLFRKR
ncbi:unnamed protein product [Cyclocybe aegerita]|uniref:Cytochrome P450 n=1 Tax=Cyclocybe aegerita TaxID=1973307 RepID=A0A8S0VT15_CYCAE|nr:unnamed protein product [Cyclocybe aegerita]